MCPGRVVDCVLATAGRAALQATQLPRRPRMIEQLDLARVQHRQQIPIQLRAHLFRNLIRDAVLLEAFPWPLPREIQHHLRDCFSCLRNPALRHYTLPVPISVGVHWNNPGMITTVEGDPVSGFLFAVRDLLTQEGWKLHQCEAHNCSRFFVKRRPRQKYCSKQCLGVNAVLS